MDGDLNLSFTADNDFDGVDLEEDPTTGDSSLIRDKQLEGAMILMLNKIHREERPIVFEKESVNENKSGIVCESSDSEKTSVLSSLFFLQNLKLRHILNNL